MSASTTVTVLEVNAASCSGRRHRMSYFIPRVTKTPDRRFPIRMARNLGISANHWGVNPKRAQQWIECVILSALATSSDFWRGT